MWFSLLRLVFAAIFANVAKKIIGFIWLLYLNFSRFTLKKYAFTVIFNMKRRIN